MKNSTKEPTDGLRNRSLYWRIMPFMTCAFQCHAITYGEYSGIMATILKDDKRTRKHAKRREKGVSKEYK